MTAADIIELSEVPGFGAVYARAAAQAARMKARKPSASSLPDRSVTVRGLTVDRDHYANFQHLMGDSVGTHLHPGYVHVLTFPLAMHLLTEKDFPLPLLGMVHITNEVTQTRGIAIDEPMNVVASIRNPRPHYAGTLLDAVVEVWCGDELVLVDTSGYLVRGSNLGGPRPDKPEREEFTPPPASQRWKLAADAGRKYATVSGDANPIHLSAMSAKLFGFDRAIVHGMYSASRAFTATGVSPARELTWSIEFEAPVKLPGTVMVGLMTEVAGEGAVFGPPLEPGRTRVSYMGWREGKGDRPARRHFFGCVEHGGVSQ